MMISTTQQLMIHKYALNEGESVIAFSACPRPPNFTQCKMLLRNQQLCMGSEDWYLAFLKQYYREVHLTFLWLLFRGGVFPQRINFGEWSWWI